MEPESRLAHLLPMLLAPAPVRCASDFRSKPFSTKAIQCIKFPEYFQLPRPLLLPILVQARLATYNRTHYRRPMLAQ